MEAIADFETEPGYTQLAIGPVIGRAGRRIKLGRFLRVMTVIVSEFVAHDLQAVMVWSVIVGVAPGPENQAGIAVQVDKHTGGVPFDDWIRRKVSFLIRKNTFHITRDRNRLGF